MGRSSNQPRLESPNTDLFRESYRGFLDHVARMARGVGAEKIVDRGYVWLEAGKQGLLRYGSPEEYGGGRDPEASAATWIVAEETTTAYAASLSPAQREDVVRPYLSTGQR